MQSKKKTLVAAIFAAAIACMVAFSAISNIAQKPIVTEGEFPFSITYELNGEPVTIDSVYRAHFTGNDGYIEMTTRCYEGAIDGLGPGDTQYLISESPEATVYLDTNFYADYLMGDPEYDYFENEAFEPRLYWYDSEYQEYTDEQSLLEHGVKLISWDYPEPIENSFVFSHIAPMSSNVVVPLALIALLALIAIIILVKKEEGLEKRPIDRVSAVLNFVIGLTLVPFTTVYGIFSDINGSSTEFLHQLGYLIPTITLLGLAASVALRRMGYRGAGLAVQFVGPIVFALFVICASI